MKLLKLKVTISTYLYEMFKIPRISTLPMLMQKYLKKKFHLRIEDPRFCVLYNEKMNDNKAIENRLFFS